MSPILDKATSIALCVYVLLLIFFVILDAMEHRLMQKAEPTLEWSKKAKRLARIMRAYGCVSFLISICSILSIIIYAIVEFLL